MPWWGTGTLPQGCAIVFLHGYSLALHLLPSLTNPGNLPFWTQGTSWKLNEAISRNLRNGGHRNTSGHRSSTEPCLISATLLTLNMLNPWVTMNWGFEAWFLWYTLNSSTHISYTEVGKLGKKTSQSICKKGSYLNVVFHSK